MLIMSKEELAWTIKQPTVLYNRVYAYKQYIGV